MDDRKAEARRLQADAERLLRAEQPGQALEAATEAIRADPGLADAYETRAAALEKLGRFREASGDSRRAHELAQKRETGTFRQQIKPDANASTIHYVIGFIFLGVLGIGIQYGLRGRVKLAVAINVVLGIASWSTAIYLESIENG